ncbi:hypothetical protein [Clostridium perfringens]|uniref:hypothetical protein n=1 Tax=Clostridium perfringens TaxID=1502 RepID=UPI001C8640F2|nr:hypothetical protein [Clostridium perfringens]MCC5420366.1 hypothetical protein [Clostridium perfringens]MCC5429679.1 hypothetical protein [Clostridium perfringens]MCC5445678.1 hypothetical protein [Clostridium perfringens]MCC5448160.1 hypothetical protein [Clostridium perfringens]MDK0549386.1 hypothetical protein [Clostridium perfringens]
MNFNNIKNNDKIKNLIFILLSIFIFASSYMITYFYNSRKIQQTNMKVTEKKGELVLAENMDVIFTRRTLDDHVVVDYKTTIGEMVKNDEINGENMEELISAVEKDGYKLVSSTSGEIIFLNDMGILEAGKYYIGEKDGYIAIFKAGEDGRAFIENPEDVSTKKIEDLPEVDRSKISNFEKKYDTREECEENITNYIS